MNSQALSSTSEALVKENALQRVGNKPYTDTGPKISFLVKADSISLLRFQYYVDKQNS